MYMHMDLEMHMERHMNMHMYMHTNMHMDMHVYMSMHTHMHMRFDSSAQCARQPDLVVTAGDQPRGVEQNLGLALTGYPGPRSSLSKGYGMSLQI